jgi:ferric-dicitrate binding protein FerR (iron transport regulator)
VKRSDNINDDLLVKYLLDTVTPVEKGAVEKWLNEREENRRYYQHFQTIWQESRQLAVKSTVDENEAWKRFQQRVGAGNAATKVVPLASRTNTIFPFLKIAAVVLVLLGAGGLWLLLHNNKTVITADTQVASQVLPDGSAITLNKGSRLTYANVNNTREVSLKGEAFFDVAKDENKPFVIKANDVTIRVLGTSFNVKTQNGATSIIVESGAIEVSKGGKVLQLKKNERTTIREGQSSFEKQTDNDELYNYYRTKSFVCNNTPLWKLVSLMNEVYGVDIVIENEAKRNLAINTTFPTSSLDENLEIISLTYDIQVTRSGSRILLK